MRCPACGIGEGHLVRRHSATAAAQHFVPCQRDPGRHKLLAEHLQRLWGQEFVEVQMCEACGFGFAVPFVGGDQTFYSLAHEGDPHYPDDRWEFGETLSALPHLARPFCVAEVGAGHGAFLDQLRSAHPESAIVAADFDEGAVAMLRSKGYEAFRGSLPDFVEIEERFDVVCMFQTLEHMADLETVFDSLHAILKPTGSVFVSVPNGAATTFQEEVTGYWDMPPNHVGRWSAGAIRRAAERFGFAVEVRTQPIRTSETMWQLAVSSVNARSSAVGTLDFRVNGINTRQIRGALKRVIATSRAPSLAVKHKRYQPLSFWVQLTIANPLHTGSS